MFVVLIILMKQTNFVIFHRMDESGHLNQEVQQTSAEQTQTSSALCFIFCPWWGNCFLAYLPAESLENVLFFFSIPLFTSLFFLIQQKFEILQML